MALLKRLVVGGLRVYKPKIQATKPRDTGKMVADGVVVSLPSAALSVESKHLHQGLVEVQENVLQPDAA